MVGRWLLAALAPAALAQLRGSLDACAEAEVPWTALRKTVFGFLDGQSPQELLPWVRRHAVEGGLDPQDCDCWYGWMTARFFVPLVLEPTQRDYMLEQQLFHTEWLLWLGAPWVEMLDSPWDVPRVLAATAAETPSAGAGSEGCAAWDLAFLEGVQAEGLAGDGMPSVQLAAAAAAVLRHLPEDALTGGAVWQAACPAFAAASAVLVLGLAPHGHRLTVGYTFHAAQKLLMGTGGHGLLAFLSTPWPVAALLKRVAEKFRDGRARHVEIGEDELAEQVVAASRAEFPAVPPSFLPPVTRRERLQLLAGLAATHEVLTAARVPYFTITGTLLGAMRHHGFVPWDGDADVCVDIRDEGRLLQLVLLQGGGDDVQEGERDASLVRAARILAAGGFELFANAERPLTFKLGGRGFPRVPGKAYGYPYVDLWFCHGWQGGPFSMQSAGFGVPMPRELVFPRRKIYFAGLALWAFGEPRESLTRYYGEGDWSSLCVGHATFHRQERKFSEESEAPRFAGRQPCSELAGMFAFAGRPEAGLPAGVAAPRLLRALEAWLQRLPEPAWVLDPDGPPEMTEVHPPEPWRAARQRLAGPLRLEGGAPSPLELEEVNTSRLVGGGGAVLHWLTEARLSTEGGGSCELLLRWQPLDEGPGGLDTQLLGAGMRAGVMLLEGDGEQGAYRLEVPSCTCRQNMGGLRLLWVAEDSI